MSQTNSRFPLPERLPEASVLLPWAAVVIAGLVFGVGFAWLSVLRHEAFQSHAFDLGNMDQAAWNTLHGILLRFTDMQLPSSSACCHRGPVLTSRLAIHVEPLLVPLSLFYVVHSGPETLLVIQALVVATGVVPAYLLGLRLMGRQWPAVVFPLAYVLHPSLQNAVLDDFHAVTLSAAFLLWAMYFLFADRMAWFWVMAVLAASTKEEVGLLVALLGLPLLFRHRVQGVVAIVGGVAWFLFAVLVVIPHFNPGGQSPYLERYAYLGHGLRGVLSGIVLHPGSVLHVLTSGTRLDYLTAVLAPLGYVSLIGFPVLLLASPALVINMLSNDPTMYSGFYQYSAEVVPYVVVAAAVGIGVVGRRSGSATHGELLVPVLCCLVLGASIVATWRYGFTPASQGYVVPASGPHQRLEARMLRLIPPRAVVAAADEIEPHLSDRRTLYLLPTLHASNGPSAEYIALDASIPSAPVTPAELHAVAARALEDGYGIEAGDDGVLILRRGARSKRLPGGFYTFAFQPGSHVARATASWGPLRLVGVTIHPGYGWVNRSRPAVEVETYWRVTRRLPSGVRIRLYVSPVHSGNAERFGTWSYVDDSPTWDWLPLDRWPTGRTMHAALIPVTIPTGEAGNVSLAIGVSGLGNVHGARPAQRISGSNTALKIGTVSVRP